MASVSDTLTAEQGAYKWGVRDCLTTARALAESASQEAGERYRTGLARYHDMPEADAWMAALRAGGPAALHCQGLGDAAIEVYETQPGDLVFFHSAVTTRNGCWLDAGAGRELLGFVDESYEILHWTPHGLSAVINKPLVSMVLRFK